MFKILLLLLTLFTLLDAAVTKIGLSVGCVELNPFVNNIGLDAWAIFRITLLVYLLSVFFIGYRICRYRSSKGMFVLKNSLFALDVYIGSIVFSGIFHILAILI